MCYKLLKQKPRYDLQGKRVSWHRPLKNLPAFSKNHKNPDSKNEAKQNYYKFFCASSVMKCLEDFEKITVFKSLFVQLSRKGYTIVSILQKTFFLPLLNGVVMVTNYGSIACKCFK